MTRAKQIKARLMELECGDDLMFLDAAKVAEWDDLKRELGELSPVIPRNPAERARWAIRETRKVTAEAVVSLRLSLAKGDLTMAGYYRRRIAENRQCVHSFLRDLKAAGAA